MTGLSWDTAPQYLLRESRRIHMVRPSEIASRRWESRRPLRQRARLGRTPPYVERIIGSVRANVWITSSSSDERHLRGVLSSYFHYYHKTRTHLSLDKDCPESRPIHPPAAGKICSLPGGRWSASSLRTARCLCPVATVQGRRLQRGTCSLYKCVTRMYWHPKLVHGWVAAATVALLT